MDAYEVIQRIGRGHYGTVFVVRDVRDGKLYCLKKIGLDDHSPSERESAAQEVNLLRSLDHPCIVQYREHFLDGEDLCLIMTYCEGGDLASVLKRQKARGEYLPEPTVLEWLAQLALALAHTHERRILHRDLKTQNVFLTRGRLIKLGDFGIARVLDGSQSVAQTVIGTPYYMSPEVCQNRPYSYKSDVWALGCVLYEMLALRQAWDGSNLLGLVYKIVQETYEPPPPFYSDELRALLASMLAKDPARRPSVGQILRQPLLRRAVSAIAEADLAAEAAPDAAEGALDAPPHHAPEGAAGSPAPPALAAARVRRPLGAGGGSPAAPARGAGAGAGAAAGPGGGGGGGGVGGVPGSGSSGSCSAGSTPRGAAAHAPSRQGAGCGAHSQQPQPQPPQQSARAAQQPSLAERDDRAAELTPKEKMRRRKMAAADEAAQELAAAALSNRRSTDEAQRRGRLMFERSSVELGRAAGGGGGAAAGGSGGGGGGGGARGSPRTVPGGQLSAPELHAATACAAAPGAGLLAGGAGSRGGSAGSARSAPAAPHRAGGAQPRGARSGNASPREPGAGGAQPAHAAHAAPEPRGAGAGAGGADGAGAAEPPGGGGLGQGRDGSAPVRAEARRLSERVDQDHSRLLRICAEAAGDGDGGADGGGGGGGSSAAGAGAAGAAAAAAPGGGGGGGGGGCADGADGAEPPPANSFEPMHSAADRTRALRERCRAVLGRDFEAVYAAIRAHHDAEARGAAPHPSDVKVALTAIVGRERLAECFIVDQLLFQELFSAPSARG